MISVRHFYDKVLGVPSTAISIEPQVIIMKPISFTKMRTLCGREEDERGEQERKLIDVVCGLWKDQISAGRIEAN